MESVLGTVELLELILSHVNLQSLLVSAVRVSHLWNHVIQDSRQLQTLLFFNPDTSLAEKNGQLQSITRKNPLLLRYFGARFTNTSDIAWLHAQSDRLPNFEPSWHRMLIQQPAAKKLGIWRVETGHSFQHGFENTTEIVDFGEKGELSTGDLVKFIDGLGQRSPWTVYWGKEGRKLLEEERSSLFVLKARPSERASLFEMWETSDVVVRFTRWTGAK